MGFPADISTKERLENREKYFNFSGTYKNFSVDASYTEAEPELMFALPSISDGTDTFFKSTRFTFGYNHEFSEKIRAALKFTYSQNFRSYRFDFDLLGAGVFGFEENGSKGYRVELNMFLNPTEKVNLTIGATYQNVLDIFDRLNIPSFNLANQLTNLSQGETVVTQALFAQVNLKLSDQFKIVAGARLEQMPEYTLERTSNAGLTGFESPITGLPLEEEIVQGTYEQTRTEFIPRVAVIYTPNEKNVIKFLYGKAINRPSFFQNRDLFDPTRDPLEPETIQTLELNYIGYLSPKFSVNLSIFRNMLDKLIFRSVFLVGGQYLTYNANVGEMVTNGLELTINTKPVEDFELELSGVYQDTTDKRYEDVEVGYSPKLLGYIKASYFFTKDISLAVTGTYVGDMEAYWDDTQDPPIRYGDGETIESYFLLGANLRVRNMFGTGMFLNVRGSNLLDEVIFYPTTASNLWATAGTIGRGLTFLLTLGWKF
jgi:outer membrane receptor protein involved in Fe transport